MKFTHFFQTLLLLISLSFGPLNAQSFDERYFHSVGTLMELTFAPAKQYTALDYNQTPQNYVNRYVYYSGGIQYEGRFNIFNLNDENAFSVSVAPSIGLAIGRDTEDTGFYESGSGYGNFHIPLMVNYEVGGGSTYESDSDFGAAIGFGYQFTFFPLFGDVPEGVNKKFAMPMFRVSLRGFGNYSNNLREYFIHFWPGSTKRLEDGNGFNDYRSFMVKIGFSRWLIF